LPLIKKDINLTLLAAICLEFHRNSSDGIFYLSVRKAREAMPDLSVQGVHNKFRTLAYYGVIEEVEKGIL